MPKFDQDITIFEDDTYLLQYTFSDLQENFTSDWGTWWGVYEASSWPPLGQASPVIQKHTIWNNVASGGGTLAQTNGSDGNPDIRIVVNSNIIEVIFTQQDFESTTPSAMDTDGTYYAELVTSPDKDENTSLVAASGLIYISSSIFSVVEYRP